MLIIVSVLDQSDEISVLDGDKGSVSSISVQDIIKLVVGGEYIIRTRDSFKSHLSFQMIMGCLELFVAVYV